MELSPLRRRRARGPRAGQRPSAAQRRAAALARADAPAAAEASAAARAASPPAAAAPPLAAEDLLLVVWVLFGSRLVLLLPAFRDDAGVGPGAALAIGATVIVEPSLAGFAAIAAALGVGGWLVALSMLFVFWTRGPEDVDLDAAVMRRFLFVGPAWWLLGVSALAVNAVVYGLRRLAARLLGRSRADIEIHRGWPGWLLPSAVRRVAALPAILGGELAFRSALVATAGDWQASPPLTSDVVFAVLLAIPAYAFFVVAPRLATGGVLKVWPWVVRFAVYLAAVFAGEAWLQRLF